MNLVASLIPIAACVSLILALCVGCAGPGIRPGKPVRFSGPPPQPAGEEFPNWPHPPVDDLAELDRDGYELIHREWAGGGISGAQKAEIWWKGPDQKIRMKGKPAPPGRLDGFNNTPRKEMAAYRIQQLFLDPIDYVVPSTGVICVPMAQWEATRGPSEPSIPGTACVVTNLSIWLDDVELPDPLFDEDRFLTDPVYAWHLANFNVLTYLINQRDTRRGNVLVAKNDSRRIVFSIDNGVSFGARVYNWVWPPAFVWTKIRVPALPRRAVDRLRTLRREDLDALLVVAQLEADSEGILRQVPPTPPIEPIEPVSIDGTTVQMGLTTGEIDALWDRLEKLVEAVDEGRLPLF